MARSFIADELDGDCCGISWVWALDDGSLVPRFVHSATDSWQGLLSRHPERGDYSRRERPARNNGAWILTSLEKKSV